MAIIVDNDTRLVVQGLTGSEGRFHGLRNKAYGTNVVAGVTPGKGGQFFEHGSHRVGDRAQFTHLIGQDVARPAGSGVIQGHWSAEV